jgi:Urocanase Rossmann-like domain
LVSDPAQETSVREASDSLQIEACSLYRVLTRTAMIAGLVFPGREMGLGGKLLYAGELNAQGRARVVAGNVAGCATLAATADVVAQKLSIRDGVVDFLVNSLDETLRILKNEIRQHKTVAVCVGAAPDTVEREMEERGVQPDMVFAGLPNQRRALPKLGAGTHEIQLADPNCGGAFLTWRVGQTPARWMPKLDAVALGCVEVNSWQGRWMRLSPRYLGRSGFALRTIFCDQRAAKEIIRQFAESVQRKEIGAEVSMSLACGDETTVFRLKPGESL